MLIVMNSSNEFLHIPRCTGQLIKAQDYQLSAQSSPIIQRLFVSDHHQRHTGARTGWLIRNAQPILSLQWLV